jgi:fructose-1,6-bisphosphatase II / sedoheptulose-1,7-bisphosphatase
MSLAKAKGVKPNEIRALVLDRPRHSHIIEGIRSTGAAVQLITDGDVAGVIATSDPMTGIDIYMGQGGAPEGVLAAAALRCVGGQIQTRLVFKKDDEKRRAEKLGIKDFNKKYTLMDLASGDVIFAASGVTDGSMLRGVHRDRDFITTESIVMRSATGTVRWVKTRHSRKNAR